MESIQPKMIKQINCLAKIGKINKVRVNRSLTHFKPEIMSWKNNLKVKTHSIISKKDK
jgi:hypothetical protein